MPFKVKIFKGPLTGHLFLGVKKEILPYMVMSQPNWCKVIVAMTQTATQHSHPSTPTAFICFLSC